MTLPLTLEQTRAVVEALRRDGHAWLDVGWKHCWTLPGDPPNMPTPPDVCQCGEHFAPSEWAEAAAAVCGRCDGDGGIDEPDGRSLIRCQCPDCRGTGKPVHTLTVWCDEMHVAAGDHYYHVDLTSDDNGLRPADCTVSVNAIVSEVVHELNSPWSIVIGNISPGDWVAHLEAVT